MAENILHEFKQQNVSIPTFQHICNWAGPVQTHNQKEQKQTTTHLTSDQVLLLLYVDDGVAPFETRDDAAIGTLIIQRSMAAFGLTVHVGSKEKPDSKTKAMYFLSRNVIQKWCD